MEYGTIKYNYCTVLVVTQLVLVLVQDEEADCCCLLIVDLLVIFVTRTKLVLARNTVFFSVEIHMQKLLGSLLATLIFSTGH